MLVGETFGDAFQPLYNGSEALLGRFAGVSLFLLVAALLLHVAKVSTRALAWHNILRAAYPDERLRLRHSLGAYLCGIGLNAVLPARPGELLKLVLVKRQAPTTRYPALASTLVTESAFDSVAGAVTLVFGIAVAWTSISGSLASTLAPLTLHPWLDGAAALATVIGLRLAWQLLGKRLRGVTSEARRGFAIFGCRRRYLRTVVSWQLAALALRLASICCFLAAFHLPLSIQAAVLVLAVQCVSGLVPVTPNGAGIQQAMLLLAFGAGTTAASVISFGAGAQIATAVADVLLALASLALMTGSLRWRRLLVAKLDPNAAL